MSARTLRRALIASTSFLALTAFAGGIGLALDLNAPPVAMLAGTPFKGYWVPALALIAAVGGGALVACVLAYRRHRRAVPAAFFASAMILCFEAVEIWAIGSPPGVARNLQVLYVALGLVIALLALGLRRAERAEA